MSVGTCAIDYCMANLSAGRAAAVATAGRFFRWFSQEATPRVKLRIKDYPAVPRCQADSALL